jgi:hypothetical protein
MASSDLQLGDAILEAFEAVQLFGLTAGGDRSKARKIPMVRFRAAAADGQAAKLFDSEIAALLASQPECVGWHLSVPPGGPGGFAIDLVHQDREFRGEFGELREEFSDISHALLWIDRAISNTYQLRTTVFPSGSRHFTLEPKAADTALDKTLSYGEITFVGLWFGWLLNRFTTATTVIKTNEFIPSQAASVAA